MIFRLRTKTRKIVALIISVSALSIAALLIGASVYANRAAFRQHMLDGINNRIAGQISIGDHHLSIPFGRLTLKGVVLSDQDGTQLAFVERLDVHVFLPALLWREIRLTAFDLDTVNLNLAFDRQGHLQIQQALALESAGRPAPDAGSKPSSSWQVSLDDFRLQQGHIRFEQPATRQSGQAEQVAIFASGNLRDLRADVRITVGRLTWQQPGMAYSLDGLKIEAGYAGVSDSLSLTVGTPESNLSVRGRAPLANLGQEPLDLIAELDLSLAELQPFAPVQFNPRGRLKGRLSANGPIADPAAAVQLSITEGRLLDVPVQQLDVEARLNQRQVTISHVRTHAGWGDLSLSGSMDLRPMFPENFKQSDSAGLPAYALTLQGSGLQPQKLPHVAFPWGGTWRIQADTNGQGFAPSRAKAHSRIQIHAADVKAVDVPDAKPFDGQVLVDLTWAEQVLTLNESRAGVGESELSAQGSLDFERRNIALQAALNLPELAQLGRIAGVQAPAGQAELEMDVQGPWKLPNVLARLQARELALDPTTFGNLSAEVRLGTDGVVHFSHLNLENQGSVITGSGTLSLLHPEGGVQSDPAVNLKLAFEQLEIDDFYTMQDVDGEFNGRIDIAGTVDRLSADMNLHPSRLRWQKYAPEVSGQARFQNDRLTVSQLRLATADSSVELAGSARLRDPETGRWLAQPVLQGQLKSAGLRLEDFFEKYTGRVTAHADFKGPVSDLHGSFEVKGDKLDLAVQKLDSVQIAGKLGDQKVVVSRAAVAIAPGEQITGSGWFGFDQQFELFLSGNGIDLASIQSVEQAYPLQGILSLDVSGRGSLQQPEIKADLRIDSPRLKQQSFDDFTIGLQLSGRRLQLSADLNFKVGAQADLDSGAFNLQADFARTDLDPFLSFWQGPLWRGELSGSIQAAGNWNHPAGIDSTVSVTDAVLLYNDIKLFQFAQFSARIEDGRFFVPKSRVKLIKDGFIDVSAAGNLHGNMQVAADGRLPLAALAPFSQILADADGDIILNADLRGPLDNPEWQADLTVSRVNIGLPGMLQPIEKLNGRVRLTHQSLAIESLAGNLGGGEFTVQGQVGLDNFKPEQGRITVKANALTLIWPDTMDAVVSGELELTGSGEKALLAGAVTLVEGTYYKDVRIDLLSTLAGLTKARRAEPVPDVGQKPEWMKMIELDINVKHRNPLLVDNNLATMEIVPDLAISGTLARPVITGQARVVNGRLTYRRTSFEITRGVVDFVNPYRIEPTLDIQAQTRVRDWEITLALTGPMDRLALQLSSNPPESDSDILALLLVGRTGSEIGNGEGGSSQSPSQMLAGLVASEWGEGIRKRAGLDILEVETGPNGKEAASDEEDEDRIQVTLGKRLSRRLTLKYEVEHGNGETVQRAVSEYRLLEHLLASGFQDSQGGYGGELLFRINFR